MKKIIVAPGAFKHSISVLQAVSAITDGLRSAGISAELQALPIADGGNGTLDAFLVHGGERISRSARDPLGRMVTADYGLIDDGKTAIVEMAQASGLELIANESLRPMAANTFGTGQLMKDALSRGVSRLIVGMGGSATVDGALGALTALGVRFLDEQGQVVEPLPRHLPRIARVDVGDLDERWRSVEVIVAADVDNPAIGQRGAAAIFAPQKGASPSDVVELEAGLSHFFGLIAEQVGVDVREVAGAGAAGALSGGLMALLGARILSGIDLLLDHAGFESQLHNADLVITSEGRVDSQTLGGKGPLGVARIAHQRGVPSVMFVGGLGIDEALLRDHGVRAVMPIVDAPLSLDEALANGATLLERAARRLGWLLQIG
ncbi:MAG: glycerate kinase [Anaerolineaceae bacterium]|nr:MAG: glycerate kinase [Anaerolineaceae bacterium]